MFTLWSAAGWNITSQSLASSCYLKKANGSTFSTPYNYFQLKPTFSNYTACPDSLWQYDGDAMKAYINSYNLPASQRGLASRPTPVNRVFENGEIFFRSVNGEAFQIMKPIHLLYLNMIDLAFHCLLMDKEIGSDFKRNGLLEFILRIVIDYCRLH